MDKGKRRAGKAREVHEETAIALREIAREEALKHSVRYGTVTGTDGGNPKVHIEGEQESRQVGLARKKGTRYTNGERVAIQMMGDGEPFVLGTLGSGEGPAADQAVGEPDMHDGAISKRAMRINSVGQDQIEPNAVKGGNIGDNEISRAKLDPITRGTIEKAITDDMVKGGRPTGANPIATQKDIDDAPFLKNENIQAAAKNTSRPLATEDWVGSRNYLTSIPSTVANKSDVTTDIRNADNDIRNWVQANFAKRRQ